MSANAVNVSIVVLNWNGSDTIEACINSLLFQLDAGDELILIDNASSDGSSQTLKTIAEKNSCSVVFNPRNLGFSGGMNIGFRQAKGDVVVFANQDLTFASDFLSQVRAAAEAWPEADAFSPAIFQYGCNFAREKAGESGTGKFGLFYRPRYRSTNGRVRQSELAYGCCIIGRSAALRLLAINGQLFEEAFHSGYEDADLWLRFLTAGRTLLHVPAIRVEHLGSGSVGHKERIFQKPAWYQRQIFRNRMLVMMSDRRRGTLRKLLPVIAFESCVVLYLLMRAPSSLRHYFGGLKDCRYTYPQMMMRRRCKGALG